MLPIDTVDQDQIPKYELFTNWTPEHEQFPTQWGRLTAVQWCHREGLRLQSMYPDIRIAWSGGSVALYVRSGQ